MIQRNLCIFVFILTTFQVGNMFSVNRQHVRYVLDGAKVLDCLDLEFGNFRNKDLSSIICQHSSFAFSSARGANFQRARFSDVCCRDVDFRPLRMVECIAGCYYKVVYKLTNLSDTIWQRCNSDGAQLALAYLVGAQGLTDAQRAQAKAAGAILDISDISVERFREYIKHDWPYAWDKGVRVYVALPTGRMFIEPENEKCVKWKARKV